MGADYGSVRLEAASLQSAQPGETAQLDLTWFIADPQEPLTTFIHIVDASGSIVAQDDGPLAGPFTPFERWLPGMVLTRRHWVPLPADLPPGSYTVLAGVYPAANPAAALIPQLDSDPSGLTASLDPNARITLTAFTIAPR